MKVLVVSQYFSPENFRVNDLVQDLCARGHDVAVLTGQPNYPSGSFFPGYGWGGPWSETYGKARVLRVPLARRRDSSRVPLVINYFSFVFFATLAVLFRLKRSERFDAIFVFAPSPITVALPAILARRKFKAPLLLWLLDLWPESVVAVGAVKKPVILRGIERVVRWIYKRTDLLLVQSMAFEPKCVALGAVTSRIRWLPNWGESVFEAPVEGAAPAPGGPFRIIYTGNIGVAQDFPTIIDAATLLAQRSDIVWEIYGDGRMADWAKGEVRKRGLSDRFTFFGQKPLDMMPAIMATADVLLVSLKPDPAFDLTVPGKLQSYLAAGRPVLAMLQGEGARIVGEAKAGLTCSPGSAAMLAEQVERLAAMTDHDRKALGRNGRAYFDANFARALVLGRLDGWMRDLTQKD